MTPFSDFPRVYLTLACNYHCGFCVLGKPKTSTISGEKWLEVLDAFPSDTVALAGGEPTIYRDFALVANGLKKREVRIYTNGSFPLALLDKITRPLSFYVSFHKGQRDDAETLAKKLVEVLARGHDLINVHANVAAGDTSADARIFADHGFKLLIEPDLWTAPEFAEVRKTPARPAVCSLRRAYFGPDGRRYQCVSLLEAGDPAGFVDHSEPESRITCTTPGACSPCDAKLRTLSR